MIIGLARAVWSFLTSKVGIGVLIALAVLAAIAWWGKSNYDNGYAAGAAKVQAAIDAPVTGWSARLQQCTDNVAVKDQAIAGQNAAISKASAASAAALKVATDKLAAVQAQAAKSDAKVASLMKPLTGATVCDRVQDSDKRFLGILNQ